MSSTTNLRDDISYETKTLELKRFAQISQLGQTTLDSLKIDTQQDLVTQSMLIRLEADVLSDKFFSDKYVQSYSYEVYATPWQHFKELYAPKWFIKKYPVKLEERIGEVTVNFNRYSTYPKANIALQKDMKFFKVNLGGVEHIYDQVDGYHNG